MMERFASRRSIAHAAHEEGHLVFSDVHLGSDVNEVSPRGRVRPAALDDELAALLDHYRGTPSATRSGRWHLVVAGDFIDFVGMLIAPRFPSSPSLVDHDDAGLGSPAEVALEKLARAIERHPLVFAALGRFVGAGHAITFVVGNHDIELLWPVVQRALREAIVDHLPPATRERHLERITVEPIFHWVPGVLFVEHGHRYDPTCVNVAALAPHHPRARDRMLPSLSDVLLRLIVRRVETVDEHGHENEGLGYYLNLIVRTGTRGIANLAYAFFHAIAVAVKTWWTLVTGGLKAVRRLHRARLRRFAAFRRLGWRRVRAFDALAVKPSIASLHAIFSTLLLDRVALFGVTPFFVLGAFLLPASMLARVAAALSFVMLARMLYAHLASLRALDAAVRMERRAPAIARLFPARFVVMGHTHTPRNEPLANGARYVNTGTWAEEADSHGLVTPAAPRTHFVVEGVDAPRGELRVWRAGEGPAPWREAAHAQEKP